MPPVGHRPGSTKPLQDAREVGSLQTIPVGSSHRLVYLVPVTDPQGNTLCTVEASLPLNTIEEELAGLRLRLTWIISAAAILGVLFSFVIAGASVRPLEALLRTSREVAQGNLTSRAMLPLVSEARDLARTFNEMLDRIQASIDRQAQLTDEMRRFASDASHELRSPLAVLRNGLEMQEAARRRGDEVQAQNIHHLMTSEVDAMSALVDDLLFLARIDHARDHGGALPNQAAVDPFPLLEEVYERGQVLAAGQILRLEWPDHPIPPLYADREMLRRALNNLVENALHAAVRPRNPSAGGGGRPRLPLGCSRSGARDAARGTDARLRALLPQRSVPQPGPRHRLGLADCSRHRPGARRDHSRRFQTR